MKRQEPRPAYHRRMDLERLAALAQAHALPVALSDEGAEQHREYCVRALDGRRLAGGRHEVVHAYLQGWIDAQAEAGIALLRSLRHGRPDPYSGR
jgi:hypothetical protein